MNGEVVAATMAKNGMPIVARVTRVGRDGAKNAWRATVRVDGITMCTSHHDECAVAETAVSGMYDAYVEVHGDFWAAAS